MADPVQTFLRTDQRITTGYKIQINFGCAKKTFTAGGKARCEVGDGEVWVSAEFKFADGTYAWGIVRIDENSSGEHGGTAVFIPGGGGNVTFQNDGNMAADLGKAQGEVTPYTYRPMGRLDCHNIHLGDDGWSER